MGIGLAVQLLQALAHSSPESVTDAPRNAMSTENSLLRALQQARTLAPSGSRLVLISDFLTVDDAIEQEILGLLRRVEMTPICVQDALEHTLPKRGLLPVRSRRTDKPAAVLDISSAAQGAHATRAAQTRASINQLFMNGGQAVTHVQSHQSLADAAMQAWFGIRSLSSETVEANG